MTNAEKMATSLVEKLAGNPEFIVNMRGDHQRFVTDEYIAGELCDQYHHLMVKFAFLDKE